jgi:hypothetical protein
MKPKTYFALLLLAPALAVLPVLVAQEQAAGGPTAALCGQADESLNSLRMDFLKAFLAATSDGADPQSVSKLFQQARATTNQLAALVLKINDGRRFVRSQHDRVKRAPLLKADADALSRDLEADLSLLEALKSTAMDLQEVVGRFLSKYEASWSATLAIRVENWGSLRAMAALRKTIVPEYEKLKLEIEGADPSAHSGTKEPAKSRPKRN